MQTTMAHLCCRECFADAFPQHAGYSLMGVATCCLCMEDAHNPYLLPDSTGLCLTCDGAHRIVYAPAQTSYEQFKAACAEYKTKAEHDRRNDYYKPHWWRRFI